MFTQNLNNIDQANSLVKIKGRIFITLEMQCKSSSAAMHCGKQESERSERLRGVFWG